MKNIGLFLVTFIFCFSAFLISAVQSEASPVEDISSVLDKLHEAASKADGKAYFALFSNDAVFYGTDATERWPIAKFKPYAQKRFDTGTGWTYKKMERNIFLSKDGNTAWFDERLDNKSGEARGSGVLIKENGKWLIAQYNLLFPVPNEIFDPIYGMVKIYNEKK